MFTAMLFTAYKLNFQNQPGITKFSWNLLIVLKTHIEVLKNLHQKSS